MKNHIGENLTFSLPKSLNFDGAVGLFANSNLTAIPSALFKTNQSVIDLSYMFFNTKLTIINNFKLLNKFNNVSYCFANCSELMDVSNIKTESKINNIINYEGMFSDCASLIHGPEINFRQLSNLNLNYMYYNCNHLEKVNVDIPSTSNINSRSMFENCTSLTDVPSRNTKFYFR